MSFLARLSHHKNALIAGAVGTAAVAVAAYNMNANPVVNEPAVAFKNKDEWFDLKLVKYEDVSPDTRHFTFALPSEDCASGLITASCIFMKYVTEKGNNVVRPYTPISDPAQTGTIDFVIKKYPTGKMGNHLFNLKENDTMTFKGPIVKWAWQPNQFNKVTLIGGGSGITPLYQLLSHIAKDPQEKTKVHLVYGNKTANDILLKSKLDELAAQHPDKIQVTYFLDTPSDSVKASRGFITKDWLKENIPGPDPSHHVFVCGPPPQMEAISGNKVSPTDQGEVTGALAELGFTKEHVFKF